MVALEGPSAELVRAVLREVCSMCRAVGGELSSFTVFEHEPIAEAGARDEESRAAVAVRRATSLGADEAVKSGGGVVFTTHYTAELVAAGFSSGARGLRTPDLVIFITGGEAGEGGRVERALDRLSKAGDGGAGFGDAQFRPSLVEREARARDCQRAHVVRLPIGPRGVRGTASDVVARVRAKLAVLRFGAQFRERA